MNIFVIIQIVLSLAYVAYLVHLYSIKTVATYVKLLVFLTWFLSFSIVFILPLDIYNSISPDQTSKQYFGTMIIVWKIVYWSNFLLTWLILPIAQEYEEAGQFEWKQKLKRSIINNLIIYGVFAVVGVSFLVYLLIRGNFNIKELSVSLVAASNVFGMGLVVILLSHGIVEIPRKLWREKKYEMKLKYNQFNASIITTQKQNLLQELELKVKEILYHQNQNGKTFQNQIILSLIPEGLVRSWNKAIPKFDNINLVNLHKETKKMVMDLNRLQTRWQNLQMQTFRIEDIQKDKNSVTHTIESTLFNKYSYDIFNKLAWLWYCKIKLIAIQLLFVVLTILAISIVLAEISVFFNFMSLFNIYRRVNTFTSFVAIDVYLLLPLAYISACVFYGLFKMKLAGLYGLYPNNQTDAPSLIFTAINCSRVSTPLCYNFLQIANVQDSSFSSVMGSVDIVPVFGKTFNIVFPILLLILITFNAFDVYSKLLKALGLQRFQFQEDFNHENIADGRKKLQKARVELENKILNSRSKNLADYRSYQEEASVEEAMTNNDKPQSDSLKKNAQYFNEFSNLNQVMQIIDL